MDRIDFLKKTSIGALAAIVIPKHLAEILSEPVEPIKVNSLTTGIAPPSGGYSISCSTTANFSRRMTTGDFS